MDQVERDTLEVVTIQHPPFWARWTTQLGFSIAALLAALSLAVAIFNLAPSANNLTNAVEHLSEDDLRAGETRVRLEGQLDELQTQLAAERAEDDFELQQDRCYEIFDRAVGRAEAAAFVAAFAPEYGPQPPPTEADAARAYSDAVEARDLYVSNGYPLPCPTPSDGG